MKILPSAADPILIVYKRPSTICFINESDNIKPTLVRNPNSGTSLFSVVMHQLG
jgi:hypothetical protein